MIYEVKLVGMDGIRSQENGSFEGSALMQENARSSCVKLTTARGCLKLELNQHLCSRIQRRTLTIILSPAQ